MTIPIHWLHIYQPPAVGNAFIKRYPAYQYKHKIAANGGFDTMDCALGVTAVEAENIYENYIGCRVAVFVDNPAEPVWEGLISRATYTPGRLAFTRSIDEMMNRVRTRMSRFTGAAYTEDSASLVNNTDSQAIYGIRQGTIDGGATVRTTALPNYLPALAATNLAIRAWPQVSMNFNNQNSVQTFIGIECIGMYHTLDWDEVPDQSGNVNASVVITVILAALANATTFFDRADTSDIATNATFNQLSKTNSGMSAWQVFKQIQEAGNTSGNRYVIGVTRTLSDTGTRRLYYRQANTAVEYTARVSDNLRIRNAYGGLVDLWRVRPDRGVRVNDILVGWNGQGDDPREMYIEHIEYDADRQTVALRGTDDITWEGFFQYSQQNKAYNRGKGAISAGRKQVILS